MADAAVISDQNSFRFIATDAEAYDSLFSRGTRRLAPMFVEFAGVTAGDKVVDIGCGTGNLTLSLLERQASTTGIDRSSSYVQYARNSYPSATFNLGDAMSLPYKNGAFDRALSMLALDLFPDAHRCLSEMRRVTRPGGTVAVLEIDFRCGWTPFSMLWDTASVLDPRAKSLRDWSMSKQMGWPGGLSALFRDANFSDLAEGRITSTFDYSSFDDYWSSFLGGQGKIGSYVSHLSDQPRAELRRHMRDAYLCGMSDGARSFTAGFWVIRGKVPTTDP